MSPGFAEHTYPADTLPLRRPHPLVRHHDFVPPAVAPSPGSSGTTCPAGWLMSESSPPIDGTAHSLQAGRSSAPGPDYPSPGLCHSFRRSCWNMRPGTPWPEKNYWQTRRRFARSTARRPAFALAPTPQCHWPQSPPGPAPAPPPATTHRFSCLPLGSAHSSRQSPKLGFRGDRTAQDSNESASVLSLKFAARLPVIRSIITGHPERRLARSLSQTQSKDLHFGIPLMMRTSGAPHQAQTSASL